MVKVSALMAKQLKGVEALFKKPEKTENAAAALPREGVRPGGQR